MILNLNSIPEPLLQQGRPVLISCYIRGNRGGKTGPFIRAAYLRKGLIHPKTGKPSYYWHCFDTELEIGEARTGHSFYDSVSELRQDQVNGALKNVHY